MRSLFCRARLLVAAPVAAAVLAAAARAPASPLDDGHVGGVGFSGPTTGDLAAIYWNPAALALLDHGELALGATARLVTTNVDRAPIDPATGRPGAGTTFPGARSQVFTHPFSNAPGPGAFIGAAAAFGNRFTFAAAVYSPFESRVSFDRGPDAPTRYQALESELRSIALVPALALRIGRSVRLGFAPGFLFSTGRLVIDDDRALNDPSVTCNGGPCGVENPQAGVRYDFESGAPPLSARLSFTIAAGVHILRPRWQLGVAYTSRPLDGPVALDDRRMTVRDPATGASVCAAAPVGTLPEPCVSGQLRYRLPDIFTAGFTYAFGPAWEGTAIVRWLTTSAHDQVTLRLVWPARQDAQPAGTSERLALYRGWRDTWDVRLRAAYRVNPGLRFAFTLRGQTSAVPNAAENAGAVDGLNLEPSAAAEIALGGSVRLVAGYAAAFMRSVDTDVSAFDPTRVGACADAGQDLNAPSCRARLDGRARPTAAGRYRMTGHTLSVVLRVGL